MAAGRPLVLVHSINAGASAYEMRPIFEHYRSLRPVYALDLPGFGFSERKAQVYSPEVYKNAIIALLNDRVKERADVIALSLSSEYAAMAARERPDLIHSLTMISPTGFEADKSPDSSEESAALYILVSFPLWSQALYDLLVTRSGIRYYLQKSFYGPVDQGLVDYDYLTTHQSGARYAPLYFVSGKLFTPTIREDVYKRLTVPVLVLYDQDPFVRFDTLPDLLAHSPNWQAERIVPTRGLPHFEKMTETAQALDRFWQKIGQLA
jgi:pimeloyl-ACP methyl ester carboxylesterase